MEIHRYMYDIAVHGNNLKLYIYILVQKYMILMHLFQRMDTTGT